jgi:hypothetical protein
MDAATNFFHFYYDDGLAAGKVRSLRGHDSAARDLSSIGGFGCRFFLHAEQRGRNGVARIQQDSTQHAFQEAYFLWRKSA